MSFSDDELTSDAFLDGRLRLWQPRKGYRAATDPVLLAAFTPARAGERVLELGLGAGAAALCLAMRVPGLDLHGLELQPAYAALARRNAEANGIALAVYEGDLRRPPPDLRALAFDHVMANPPFHPASASRGPDAGRDLAHREDAPLAAWIDAGLRRLRPGGRIVLVHRAERLPEILAGLAGRAGGGRDPACRCTHRAAGAAGSRASAEGQQGAAYPLVSLNLPPRNFARGRRGVV